MYFIRLNFVQKNKIFYHLFFERNSIRFIGFGNLR